MTVSTVEVILGRVKAAAPSSPIAVFDIGSDNLADAMFASTVYVSEHLADPKLIGIFSKEHNPVSVRLEIISRLTMNYGG